eukprot:TRINITY_DN1439_c0_g1_i2.p1 TRINITY_DN1439_c0_g1~~TRINITY_DN1439_c0_g1_i2.p1  ORF type:complete len:721 (+),score=212.57 TRINITY_DN1439_c0_g1_i2:139-2301(+)
MGWRPIHYASSAGHADTVEVLLASGANARCAVPTPDDADSSSLTPEKLAKRNNQKEVVKLLRMFREGQYIVRLQPARRSTAPLPSSSAIPVGKDGEYGVEAPDDDARSPGTSPRSVDTTTTDQATSSATATTTSSSKTISPRSRPSGLLPSPRRLHTNVDNAITINSAGGEEVPATRERRLSNHAQHILASASPSSDASPPPLPATSPTHSQTTSPRRGGLHLDQKALSSPEIFKRKQQQPLNAVHSTSDLSTHSSTSLSFSDVTISATLASPPSTSSPLSSSSTGAAVTPFGGKGVAAVSPTTVSPESSPSMPPSFPATSTSPTSPHAGVLLSSNAVLPPSQTMSPPSSTSTTSVLGSSSSSSSLSPSSSAPAADTSAYPLLSEAVQHSSAKSLVSLSSPPLPSSSSASSAYSSSQYVSAPTSLSTTLQSAASSSPSSASPAASSTSSLSSSRTTATSTPLPSEPPKYPMLSTRSPSWAEIANPYHSTNVTASTSLAPTTLSAFHPSTTTTASDAASSSSSSSSSPPPPSASLASVSSSSSSSSPSSEAATLPDAAPVLKGRAAATVSPSPSSSSTTTTTTTTTTTSGASSFSVESGPSGHSRTEVTATATPPTPIPAASSLPAESQHPSSPSFSAPSFSTFYSSSSSSSISLNIQPPEQGVSVAPASTRSPRAGEVSPLLSRVSPFSLFKSKEKSKAKAKHHAAMLSSSTLMPPSSNT